MMMSVRFAFPGGAPERRDQVIQKIGSDWSSPQRPGFCFITTACVVSRGLADDCEELTVLRKLRDGYLSRLTGGPALVSHYYRVAPAIVSALDQREDKAEVYERIYGVVVQRCVDMTLSQEPHRAVEQYRAAVHDLGVMTGVFRQSQPMDTGLVSPDW
ncbi:MAG: CFI-box-CTERM domain-containing protein [Candidatus Dormibacteria bacterium]